MENHRDDAAPTLPNELLSLIFRESISSDPAFSRPSRTSIPLSLTWVNRQWRDVALSTPELWQSIALPNERARRTNANPNPTEGDCQLLKIYISRSADLPLSFALDYGGIQMETECSDTIREHDEARLEEHIAGVHRLTLIMDDVRHRWREIVVRCRALAALNVLLSSLVLGAPLLERLLVAVTPLDRSSRRDDPQLERMLDLARCPKVTSVVLQCPQLFLNPFIPDDAPLKNLTSLVISASVSQPDAFTWLQSSPNLETLSIQFIDAPPFALPHALPLTLERLTRFTLLCLSGADQEPSDPSSFVQLLRLPALRSFELIMDGSLGSDQGWPHVVELLRRSGSSSSLNVVPPLEELELLGTPLTASELLQALELLPDLKKLAIDDTLTGDTVLERLSVPNSASTVVDRDGDPALLPLCPNLQTLVLHASSASLPVLATMTSSRYHRSLNLQADGRGASEDSSLSDLYNVHAGNDQRFRTLKTFELVHSYSTLPPIPENPLFKKCQEDGLEIKQRPKLMSGSSFSRIQR